MINRDPSQQILKAYQSILEGQIVYAGEIITVGTRIPRKEKKYVHLFIESILPNNTGDSMGYIITMALQIVVIQDISEGDETVANGILETVLPLVGDPEAIIMKNFTCLTSQFSESEFEPEMSETNYIITRKLRMSHFIEQKL